METGKPSGIYDAVVAMGRAARASDDASALAQLKDYRDAQIAAQVEMAPCASVRNIAARTNEALAFMAGYCPPEEGNRVLSLLGIIHPVFGKTIPDSAAEALAAGVRLAEEYAEVQRAKERKAKREAAAKKGLDLPDVDSAVSSAAANAHFKRLREIKEGKVLEEVTESEFKEVGTEAPRAIAAFNAAEKLAGVAAQMKAEKAAELAAKMAAIAKVGGYMEDDDDLDLDLEKEEEDAPAVVVTAPTPEQIARILEASDEAGSF